MKSILMSIKPKWVAKILNGEKTIEIRKSHPKCELPIDVYIYCTKDKGKLCIIRNQFNENGDWEKRFECCKGKVVAKFKMYACLPMTPKYLNNWKTQLDNACLTEKEYTEYSKGKKTYQWIIDNLEIFDKPKKLSEFKRCTEKTCIYGECHKYMHCLKSLTKAPQSFMFIETGEESYV